MSAARLANPRRLTLVRLRNGAWVLERVPGVTIHAAHTLAQALAFVERNGCAIVARKVELANGRRIDESEGE